MNRITRMLTMTGLGLVAGVTMGAGPALAATNTTQAAAPSNASARSHDRLIDYFDSRGECEHVGYQGERWGRWDDFDCYRSHGDYALVVSDWDSDRGWPGNGWPGGWPGQHHRGWPGGGIPFFHPGGGFPGGGMHPGGGDPHSGGPHLGGPGGIFHQP
jgi:hypothetical protein